MNQMTLYAMPFACSFAVHLMLREHACPHRVQWVRRGPARRVSSAQLQALNPKAKVPALVLADGSVLTEMVAVLNTLDEQASPDRSVARRREHLQWLAFISTEIHQQILAPAFDPEAPEATVQDVHDRFLPALMEHVGRSLEAGPMLLGGGPPTGADAFLFWALLLLRRRWPELALPAPLLAFQRGMAARPASVQTLAIERAALQAQASKGRSSG